MIRTVGPALLFVTLGLSPAKAQVASVSVFGPMSATSVTEDNGSRTTAGSEFALYELGHGRKAPHTVAAPHDQLPQVMATSLPVQPISTSCGAAATAPPRQLGTRASISRRAYWPLIANAECRFGLPIGLMDSIVLAESLYDPLVVSPAGAAGLSQLMPGTATDLGVSNRFDPGENIFAGARYLRQLLDSFDGNVPLALAAYNAGPAAVRRNRGIPLNNETPGYVRRVLGYWTAPGVGPMSPMLTARQTAQMLGFAPNATN